MNILKIFMRVAATQDKKRFTFFPTELITTPQEFIEALTIYAREEGKDLEITKASMSPNFKLNGTEYNATRLTSVMGSYVVVNALHPELLDDPDIPEQKRKLLEAVWKYVVPTCFWGGLFLLFCVR